MNYLLFDKVERNYDFIFFKIDFIFWLKYMVFLKRIGLNIDVFFVLIKVYNEYMY